MGMTAQRRAILDIVLSSGEHMTAEDVYHLARERMPSIAMGTVYRNLNLLAESGHLWRFTVPGEPDHYDCNTHHHGHMLCVRCKRICDFPLPDTPCPLPSSFSAQVLDYEFVVRCICKDCSEQG